MKLTAILALVLNFIFAGFILTSCGKKKGGGSSGGTPPPGGTTEQDVIFDDGFEGGTTAEAEDSADQQTPHQPDGTLDNPVEANIPGNSAPAAPSTLLEKILTEELRKAPSANSLYDHITDINLDTNSSVPKLKITTAPANELTFNFLSKNDNDENVFEYSIGLRDRRNYNNLIENYTAQVKFMTEDRSIALIQITDYKTNLDISVLRIQKVGSVAIEPHWFEFENPNLLDSLGRSILNESTINKKLESNVTAEFVDLLQDITYDPKVSWTHYHVLNSEESQDQISRAEKIEVEISGSFKFESTHIRNDFLIKNNTAHVKPINLHWVSKPKMQPGTNNGFLSHLNPANYYLRQSNLGTQSFAKDPVTNEYQTAILIPDNSYSQLVNSENVTIDTMVRSNVNLPVKKPYPFQFHINLPKL